MAKTATKPETKKVSNDALSTAVVVQSLMKEAQPIIKKLNTLPVTTKEDYAKAAELLKDLKGLGKAAKEKKGTVIDPMKAAIKAATELFEPFEATLTAIEASVKGKMSDFLLKQKAEQQKLDEKFSQGGIKKIATYAKHSEALQVSQEVATIRKVKKLFITDPTLIPREYLVVDEVAVRKALLAGEVIPGAEMKEVDNIAI